MADTNVEIPVTSKNHRYSLMAADCCGERVLKKPNTHTATTNRSVRTVMGSSTRTPPGYMVGFWYGTMLYNVQHRPE